MTLSDDIASLSDIVLFEGFSVEQLRLLAFGSKRMILRPGETLFEQDRLSDGGYAILSGQIDLMIETDGKNWVAGSFGAGSLVGEMALVTAYRRIGTAVAKTNVELIFIPRDLFKRMLSEYPELANLLHDRISSAMRHVLSDMGKVQAKLSGIPNLTLRGPEQDDVSETAESTDIETGDDGDVV